ncbi:uncharacterized protein BP5553_07533 [Venustampulla echinocandica]|uniref:Zn(2)-C6 fungal-type domain-containing protein n=1 Tax=Venustampulla echinocandica TaxID=2656787 RepID=A0A370TGT2_9HELO|nr:uncharacterized protein BP5553_07533 [Venustampulla echinocandica]RDL34405.1 hypothetical protein BP5553_07533 [Venustampulla echinocandica]
MGSPSTSSSVAETPSSSKGGPEGDQATQTNKQPPKTSRTRFKPQLSCTLCRTRKLKCDRNLPCQNCIKRDLSASCTYVHAGLRRDKSSPIQKSTSNSKDVQSQISHLEQLVVSLMNRSNTIGNSSRTDGSPSSLDENNPSQQIHSSTLEDHWTEINAVKETAESIGLISIQDDQPNYVGSSHWEAILDNIACLKDALGNTEPQQEEKEKATGPVPIGPDLLVGSVRKVSRTEIIAALPPKRLADQLVQEFFSTPDIGCPMIHQPTFQRNYEKFWADPTSTPIIWIGMLFSILCLSSQLELLLNKSSFAGSTDVALRDPAEIMDMYREKIVQCLILGNYTEPSPYTIETLLLYYVTEHFRSMDTQFGSWMVFGLIVRAGMRLGLHRDASHYPKISILQGEIQRRLWSSIVYLDIQTSCQVGLPRMIKENMYDTQPPRDLLDEDLDENTKVLPPSRPSSDLIPCAYLNNKHRITKVFGMIVDQSNSIDPIPYEEVMKLDTHLHEIWQRTPETLKMRSVEDLNNGPIETRVHGTYPYPYSMKTCVEASVRILQCQIYMHNETRPGALLRDQKWKTSSLMAQDFLLAAMLLCLYLGHGVAVESLEKQVCQTDIRVKWSREAVLDILNGSYQIFEETKLASKEAFKAANAMKAMLAKVRNASVTTPVSEARETSQSTDPRMCSQVSSSNPTPSTQSLERQFFEGPSLPWMEPPSFETGGLPANLNTLQQPSDINQALFDTMELDWEVWDSQFYNNGVSQTPPDLFNVDANVSFPDPNATFMQWDQQL